MGDAYQSESTPLLWVTEAEENMCRALGATLLFGRDEIGLSFNVEGGAKILSAKAVDLL